MRNAVAFSRNLLSKTRFSWPSKVSENVFYQLMNGGVGGVVSVLHTALVSRYLGVANFGAFSLVLAHVLLFYGFTSWGADIIAVRRMSQEPHQQSQWLSSLVTLRFVFAVTAYVLCLSTLRFVNYEPSVSRAVAIYASIILFAPFESFIAIYQVNLRTGAAVLTTLGIQISMLVATMTAMHFNAGFIAIVWIAAISTCIRLVALCLYLREHLKVPAIWVPERWSLLLRGGVPLALASLCTSMVGRFTLFLLSQTKDMQAVGVFAAPYRLIFFLMFIPEAVMVPLYPLFCRYWDSDRLAAQHLFQKATNALTLVGLPVVVIGIFLSEFIMTRFFGSGFAGSTKAFQVLLVELMCVCTVLPGGSLLIAAGRERVSFWLNLGASGAAFALVALLVPRFGAMGAACAMLAMHLCLLASTWIYLARLHIACDWKTLGAGLQAAGAMALVILAMGPALRMPALLAGLCAYCILLGWRVGWFRQANLEVVG